MQDPQSQTPVRLAVPTPEVPADAVAAATADPIPETPATDGSSSAAPQPASDPSVGEDHSWWSPGMMPMGAMSYDEEYDGTYSYGGSPFYWQ